MTPVYSCFATMSTGQKLLLIVDTREMKPFSYALDESEAILRKMGLAVAEIYPMEFDAFAASAD